MRRLLFASALIFILPAAAGAQTRLSPSFADRIGPRLAQELSHPGTPAGIIPVLTVWEEEALAGGGSGPDLNCLGRVCTTQLLPAQVDAFFAQQGLLFADLPGRLRLRLDQSGPLMRLPEARQKTGLTGEGVLVAVIDTGLDFTHPDFIGPGGKTRVAWLLDQTRTPEGRYPDLEEIGRGAVYHAGDLQRVLDGLGGSALGAGRDEIGHGTHVASIAAGNDPLYSGVAPGARLVAVKAIRADLSGFDEDRILAGLAFSREVASLEGQPLAVNISLGNQMGAHDGSEALEIALDDLVTSSPIPVAVAVAAGNDRQRGFHARSAVSDAGPLRFPLLLPATDAPASDRPSTVTLDFWLDGRSRVQAKVVTPKGFATDAVSSFGPFGVDTWTPDGRVQLTASDGPSPLNGALRTVVTLQGGSGSPLSPGTWMIEFTGQSTRIDGWVGDLDLGSSLTPRFLDFIDTGDLVGPPATAREVVAVGAFFSRTEWIDLDGHHQQGDGEIGALGEFSSPGPTRDGRLKPELLAPGAAIAAAMSADADSNSPNSIFYSGGSRRLVMPDGRHALCSGTSMASPQVAGLAALAFQSDPSLSGSRLRDLLAVTASRDAWTGGILYHPDWGFGKADALRLLRSIAGEPIGQLDPQQSLCGAAQAWLVPDPSFGILLTAIPRDSSGLPLGPDQAVGIRSNAGRFQGPVVDWGNGLYTRTLLGTGRRGSEARITCQAGGTDWPARPTVWFVPSEQELIAGSVTGGSCHCGAGTFELLPFVLVLLAGALRLKPLIRRRR